MIETKTEYRKTICPLDCPDSCGLVASVKNGKVVALNGDRDHPFTRGVICRKMKGYPARVHSKDRILFPMQRTGKKGEGRFQRISWDQAFATLCERLSSTVEQFGGESILPFAYAGNMGVVNRFAGYPLFHKLGTTQLDETICSTAAKAGWRANCGDVPGTAPEVAEEAELIIIWGSNTRVTNMHFWPYVARARKKGAQLVVIDPYRNETAASADLHLKIEPGGDAALALGLLRKLMATGDLDYDFINTRTEGFNSLRDHLENNSDNVFAAGCGIDEGQMEGLAGRLRKTQRIYLRLGIGMTRNSRAAVNIRAITSLAAALGLFDGGRGRGVLLTSAAFSGDQSRLTWPSLATKPGRRFNMVQLGNCLQTADPPIRMMFVYNANPLSTTPDGSLVRRALADDKLFTVVHEQVMTPTARYADLLLPATTFLENRDLYTSYGHFYLGFVDAVIPPLAEAKSNFTFFQELAQKLKFDDQPFQQSLDERLYSYLETLSGLPPAVRQEGIPYGKAIRSTTGLPHTPQFAGDGPRYSFLQTTEPALPQTACLAAAGEFDDADYLARYPFKLITPPHRYLLNSTFGEQYDDYVGEVLIHPLDAISYDIEESEFLTLFNGRGWTRRKAKISDATRRGLLVAEGIFWEQQQRPAGINDLTSQKITDMGGGGTFHESRVALMKSR